MTQDEIIEMTRQAGGFSPTPEFLEAFAKLVAAKERETCAKVCEKLEAEDESYYAEFSRASDCAESIRARGEA